MQSTSQIITTNNYRPEADNAVSLEKANKFCYFGNMLDADGGCNSSVTVRVRFAWKKFHEYVTYSNWKRVVRVKT